MRVSMWSVYERGAVAVPPCQWCSDHERSCWRHPPCPKSTAPDGTYSTETTTFMSTQSDTNNRVWMDACGVTYKLR